MKKKILVLSFSYLDRDSRVTRQIKFLKDQYEVIASGLSDPGINGVEFIPIGQRRSTFLEKGNKAVKLKMRRFEDFYWSMNTVRSAVEKLRGVRTDLIVSNDVSALPLSIKLAERTGAKVLLDAHEYAPLEFDDDLVWRFLFKGLWHYVCETYLGKASAVTTVCETIRDEYEKNFGGGWNVVTNAVFYVDVAPRPIIPNRIRLIHHGSVNPSRKMENMVKLMEHLDKRFELEFMLVGGGSPQYEKLKRVVGQKGRITFRQAVRPEEISRTINEYDIGLYLLPPSGFNNRMALPNKLFEFIQARLAVAIWPSPEMAKIVRQYECGVVSDDYSIQSTADCLNNLSAEDIMRFKEGSHKAAPILCAEKNMEKFNQLVESLIGH